MKQSKIFSLILGFLVFAGCASHKLHEKSFVVMGTICDIKVVSADPQKASDVLEKMSSLLKQIESEYNFNDPRSSISVINNNAYKKHVRLTSDESWLLQNAINYSLATDGAFDITFYPIWELWKKCEKENRLPSKSELALAKKKTGYKNIILSDNAKKIKFASNHTRIHLGGMVKGYALIKCKKLAETLGEDNLLVNLGGDILAMGRGRRNGWMVGIQDPFDPDKIIKKMRVRDRAVITSGVYQRYLEIQGNKYHHIIDANTGYPAENFASVTLVYPDIENRYIPSLPVFLMGKKGAFDFLNNVSDMGYYIIDGDGKIYSRLVNGKI